MTTEKDSGGISGSRASHRANSPVVSTKGFDPGREWRLSRLTAPLDVALIAALAWLLGFWAGAQ